MHTPGETTALAAANDNGVLNIIEKAVTNPDIDVSKMRELFDLQKDFLKERAKTAFAEAMAECQAEIEPVYRESQNPDNKSKYAKYEKVDAAIRPIYTRHGFSLTFGSATPDIPGNIKVTCTCRHRLGHEEHFQLEGGLDNTGMKGGATKTAIQGAGSSVSYLRRYLTGMIFNVVYTNEDNDGVSQEAKRITEAQKQALIAELGGPGERVRAFCAHHGLEEIGELAAGSFDVAMAQIKAANDKRKAA